MKYIRFDGNQKKEYAAGTKTSGAQCINPMDGTQVTPRVNSWRFGADWPGKRCGATTRSGGKCQKPALQGKNRCQLHGGKAGAPHGERNGNYRHGHCTKEAIEAGKAAHERLRALARLARDCGLVPER